ncbi:hypothetical protein AAHC03_09813 [Spirometra sp. Aus1]|nr:unnamed protein product [Spirometra erinaceieuropaei]
MSSQTTELNLQVAYENNPETNVFWSHWRGAVIGCSIFLALIAVTVLFVLLVCYCAGKKDKSKKDSKGKSMNHYGDSVPGNPPPYQSSYVPQYIQPPEERKLAPSAQMLHYQYKRDQMQSAETKLNNLDETRAVHSPDADDAGVYESAGLAQTGPSEVKNPLFQ